MERFHGARGAGLDFDRNHSRAYLHEEIHLRIGSVFLPRPMMKCVFAVFCLRTFQVLGHKLLADAPSLGNVTRGKRKLYGRNLKTQLSCAKTDVQRVCFEIPPVLARDNSHAPSSRMACHP